MVRSNSYMNVQAGSTGQGMEETSAEGPGR